MGHEFVFSSYHLLIDTSSSVAEQRGRAWKSVRSILASCLCDSSCGTGSQVFVIQRTSLPFSLVLN